VDIQLIERLTLNFNGSEASPPGRSREENGLSHAHVVRQLRVVALLVDVVRRLEGTRVARLNAIEAVERLFNSLDDRSGVAQIGDFRLIVFHGELPLSFKCGLTTPAVSSPVLKIDLHASLAKHSGAGQKSLDARKFASGFVDFTHPDRKLPGKDADCSAKDQAR
jgi:hypothetical protein